MLMGVNEGMKLELVIPLLAHVSHWKMFQCLVSPGNGLHHCIVAAWRAFYEQVHTYLSKGILSVTPERDFPFDFLVYVLS